MKAGEVLPISPTHAPATGWRSRWIAAACPWREVLVGLFVLGLVPRLILLAARGGTLEPLEYETLAQHIAAGQGYTIARFGHVALAFGDGNLYSFLSASVYVLFGHQPIVLATLQAVIASLAAPVIFAVGARAFGWQVAALGAALAALHPGLLAYTLKLHPLGLDVLLMALMVFWVGRTGNGMRTGLLTGLSLGMGLMSRPTFFVAGVLAMAVRWRGARASIKPTLAALAIGLAIATPWIGRNWLALGRPLFISTSLEDVWKGNNPIASGSSYLPNGEDVFSAAPPELQARFRQATELDLNDVFAHEIVDFVTQRPGDFAALVARKFVYFWWLPPEAGLLYPAAWLTGYRVYAVFIDAFGLIGAVAVVRRGSIDERHLLAILIAIAMTLAVIHSLSYVEGRHRWGIEPLLLLLTARGFVVAAATLASHPVAGQLRVFRRQSQK